MIYCALIERLTSDSFVIWCVACVNAFRWRWSVVACFSNFSLATNTLFSPVCMSFIDICRHTLSLTRTRKDQHKHTYTHIHVHAHAHAHLHTHTYTRTRIQTCKHWLTHMSDPHTNTHNNLPDQYAQVLQVNTQQYTHLDMHKHTLTPTRAHAYAHTLAHTHIYRLTLLAS